MWICLNDSFVSVVTDPKDYKNLQLRARRRSDLIALIQGAPELTPQQKDNFIKKGIKNTLSRDYAWRIFLDREIVVSIMTDRLRNIYYNNFKDSVQDYALSKCYTSVWADMYELQGPPVVQGYKARSIKRKNKEIANV